MRQAFARLEEPVETTTLSFESPAYEPVRYEIRCIPARGMDGRIQNWSLKQLQDAGYQERLQEALPSEECTYFAPSVNAMSGVVVSHEKFTDICVLDTFRQVRRPGYTQRHTNVRVPCEGTYIERKEGQIITAGGCKDVVLSGLGAQGRHICITAHAGRDSLIDRYLIDKGRSSRVYASVIEAMAAYAKKYFGADPHDLVLRSFFSLPWLAFPHDPRDRKYGEFNRKLYQYLQERKLERALCMNNGVQHLSLNELVRLQADQLGIGQIQAGLLDLPVNGDFAYTRHALPELGGDMRNLVVMRRL